jgi:hypothetical protein
VRPADEDYEVASVRGVVAVSGDDEVVVPRFGGRVGEELTFDLGEGAVGTCTLTGDLPEAPSGRR